MKLSISKIHLDLKVAWKLSRNTSLFKENFIVKMESDERTFLSEVAPNIRYNETIENIESEFKLFLETWKDYYQSDEKHYLALLDKLPLKHSLRFALENVWIQLQATRASKNLSQYLNLPLPHPVETSFTVPIMEIAEIKSYVEKYSRFKSLKIKVNQESAYDLVSEVAKYYKGKLRIDGNEAWSDVDTYLNFENKISELNVEFIEQPMPAACKSEYLELFKQTKYSLIADESVEDIADFEELRKMFHGINIKLMKTGSLIKARDLLIQARTYKMKTMIGCMIETGIGIYQAMLLTPLCDFVDLDGSLLLSQDPFPLVFEEEGIIKIKS